MSQDQVNMSGNFTRPAPRAATIHEDRLLLQLALIAQMTVSIRDSSAWPGPAVRAEFAADIRRLESEQECQRAYFWLHDWATELESMARACSLRAVALGAVNSVDDPRR